ncbi:MAG: tetratricopeptide repeat protein [Parvibaculum sp.]|uniref:tetratricopeptide repeat protein n=1 Tax=Parvibaculum sp. TaxID=2024848 RepID=UPI00284FA0FE|nr:tetratricopeptide repeat protein [Parvibaculum sp.]MDR3497938.1 tetratricopeptide repeat protein [Parvibaculum sp.]
MASKDRTAEKREAGSRRPFAIAAAFLTMLALQGCAGVGVFDGGKPEAPYGAYLAARYAGSIHQPDAAAKYFDKTLAADPGNAVVTERAFMVALNAGQMDRAVDLAKSLVKISPDHRMARLVLSLNDIRRGNYGDARKEIGSAESGIFVALVGSLTEAWAAAGDGDEQAAMAKLKTFEGKPAFDLFRVYHTALILDLLGNAKGADANYAKAMEASNGTSIRIVQAYSSFLDRQGRTNEARAALDQYATLAPEHPLVRAALRELTEAERKGEKVRPLVSNASEGVAEALYGLGSALAQDQGNDLAELYLQLAIWLRPDFDVARTLLADSYEQKKRWADAVAAYGAVSKGSPLYGNARIQIALDLDRLDRDDEAIVVLNELAADNPKALDPITALGDIYRGKEKYAEAAVEYTRAIAMSGVPKPADWPLYYARGICNERLGQWPQAESDLKLAQTLSGDNALVLNYLGYSWIERGENLKEALAMIEKAVEQRPTDGFIVDSLGWAEYRLGNYSRAAEVLERAVELEPGDSTINEHLGDALWKVGRHIEARFQWSHALDMKPDADRIAPLKAKLEGGLDAGEALRQHNAAPRSHQAEPASGAASGT